jgi:Ca-activated chloride channel family protein
MFQQFVRMATPLEYRSPLEVMSRDALVVALMLAASGSLVVAAQAPSSPRDGTAPMVTFKSSIDLVRVSAVVRDRKGKFVGDLAARDFEVLDNGQPRAITEFRQDEAGVSVALLLDVSGSMEAQLGVAREEAVHVFSWLQPDRDEAAVFTFDTELQQLTPFTNGLGALPASMASVVPFGATSLNDAIAQTARKAATRQGPRRAVIVLTDGRDNASHLTPSQVSGIASSIDVPVYIIGLVPGIDNPSADLATVTPQQSALTGQLANLAAWTGGRVFMASTPADRSVAARQIVEELRHQYLLAFESSGKPGWHPLVVRARGKDLVVRARSGYFAGQSRPNSE